MKTLHPPNYDVLIIGGGVNGCGIARDAAGRGFSVCLCEANDLASGTSSAATKLIHGGLRYLEYYEFRLVREALLERETLWKIAPHIIWPLRFVLPYQKGLRPRWLLRLGLLIYDYIGGRKLLPPTRTVDLESDPAGTVLLKKFHTGFEYSDCWVIDSRLVVLNARDAANRGADIRTRSKVEKAIRDGDGWSVEVLDAQTGDTRTIRAKILINAAGPWVDEVLAQAVGRNGVENVRLVRGSHIVIRKKYEHDRCYTLQSPDGRVIFAIPYESDYTLIGTTDVDHDAEAGEPKITDAELDYLCETASEYFREPVMRSDVVWTYSGVRPLYDDGASKAQEATRDYVIKVEGDANSGTLINIFGGKITTYRRLAENILEHVEARLGKRRPRWTGTAPLPGGDFSVHGFDELVASIRAAYPFLDTELAERLTRHYGTRTRNLLGEANDVAALGQYFGAGVYAAEVDYLMKEEWAMSAEDVLFRRTKQGIRMSEAGIAALSEYMASTRDRFVSASGANSSDKADYSRHG